MGPWTDHGANTGGYYKCNKYDPQQPTQEEQDGAKAKAELDRCVRFGVRGGVAWLADWLGSHNPNPHRHPQKGTCTTTSGTTTTPRRSSTRRSRRRRSSGA